jgi:hypothetical protein
MGKYFKEQHSKLPYKKRFKSSNLSSAHSIREASLLGAFSSAAINLNKLKNFFWTFNKISKNVKLDPNSVKKLETAFEKISNEVARNIEFKKKAFDAAENALNKVTPKDPGYNEALGELNKAEANLKKAQAEGIERLQKEVNTFNQETKAPIFLDLKTKIDPATKLLDAKLDFGLLSKGSGDAIDVEALKKALVVMREVNPADADPLKRIMSFFRGGVGMMGDATRPLRNISGDLTIKNLMRKKYTFEGPVSKDTGERAIIEYTLSDILEETVKNGGRFSPPAGYRAAPGVEGAVRSDFDSLMARTKLAQSGFKDPLLLSGISILAALVGGVLSKPYWIPLVAGIPSITKRFTDPEGGVAEQEKDNDKLFRPENQQSANKDLDQALNEKINEEIQYYNNKLNTESNPIFARQYEIEIRRLQRRLQRRSQGNQ